MVRFQMRQGIFGKFHKIILFCLAAGVLCIGFGDSSLIRIWKSGTWADHFAAGGPIGILVAHADENEDYYRDGPFELPVEGASGYASVTLALTDESGVFTIRQLEPGCGFIILKEEDGRLQVQVGEDAGYVPEEYVLINLPDILPSIVYNDTNSDASLFMSSGYELPGVTGQQLYNACFQNDRLNMEQYAMPVLYPMALKLANVQRTCRKNGQTLILYESYRPRDVQMEVSGALSDLSSGNSDVQRGLNQNGFNQGWFIAQRLSNHQLGVAVDVSMGQVEQYDLRACGPYLYNTAVQYFEREMPCLMHELSVAAAAFASPVSSSDDVSWRYAASAPTMTEAALELQRYCTDCGLSPLSSEWWHFNDLETKAMIAGNAGDGGFRLPGCYSREPGLPQP